MLKRYIDDTKKYFKYAIQSAKCSLKAEVANSYLNWLWWILDPISFMLIYTFIFGYVFNAKENFFPVFIFIGLTMWDFFNKTIQNSVKIVRNNKAIVSKVYLPKFVLIYEKMFINGFKMLISWGIVVIMLFVWQVSINWNILYFIPILAILFIFTFGCATHLLHYGVYVEDLSNVTAIVLRLIFYMTGIFYNVSTRIKGGVGAAMEKYNPLACLISSMRKALLDGSAPSRKLLLLWLAVGLIIAFFGIRKIYKNENSYVKVI